MVKGQAALRAKFSKVPELVKEELIAAMEKSAKEIVSEMKSLAPKDTRALADSIGWTWGEAPKGTLRIGKVANKEYGKISITIFAGGDAIAKVKGGGVKWRSLSHIRKGAFALYRPKGFGHDYAKYQEFGTKKMAANPFFWPVIRSNKSRIKGRITRAVKKGMKRAN